MAKASTGIRLRGVRQNNLKGIDLDLPLGELIVVTGVSGSGKSSLAFDTVYAEGQRRYVETFSPYARQFLDRMDRPQADAIDGIPPAIAIDQTNPVRTSRSTVGTMTELNDHLKLLFARAARLFCHGCGHEVRRDSPESIWASLRRRAGDDAPRVLICFEVAVPEGLEPGQVRELLAQQGYVRIHQESAERIEVIQDRLRLTDDNRGRAIEALEAALHQGQGRLRVYPIDAQRRASRPWPFSSALHCADCDIGYRDPTPSLFSFNSPVGACPECRGFGRVIGVDWSLVVPDASKSLLDGAVRPIQSDSYAEVQEDLIAFANRRGIPVDVPWAELSDADRRWVIDGEGEWEARVWYGLRRFFDWLEGRSYKMHVRVLLSRYRSYAPCPACGGARLKDEALDWRIGDHAQADAVVDRAARFRPERVRMPELAWLGLPGLSVHDVMQLPIGACRRFFDALTLPGAMDQAMDLLLTNIRSRLRYLGEVGLGYLTLDRQSRTLSGGEVQRINLTTALGTSLVNTLFVLDEPSIGLHVRDMGRIIGILHRLRDQGNSLLVVEHDADVMRAADRVIDMGPGPGERGGQIVFHGTPTELLACDASLTADYLSGRRRIDSADQASPTRPADTGSIRIRAARANNLRRLDAEIPLGRLVVLTGVSGSGKSTLMHNVLFQHLTKAKGHPEGTPGDCDGIDGADLIDDVLLLDQAPIGRTSRSCPASYVGALDALRKRFAAAPEARDLGFKAGHFSFNAGPGRCPTCGGSGFEQVEMQFLSDVYLRCPDCGGRRYRREVLQVGLPEAGGANIADVLEMTVTEALACFVDQAEMQRALQPLADVGLDYLRLGQPVPTLSGGEAQRLKLAGHLAKSHRRRRGAKGLLFLLDEPTTGLHFDDIATLLRALRRLLLAGHSLLVIEHNRDIIAAADWLIDLGPEGGDGGGRLVACGTPSMLTEVADSHTGRALADRRDAIAATSTDAVAERLADYSAAPAIQAAAEIEIRHAREHNLKDLTLSIPRDQLVVVTGVSGSGKSTLAFDILFAEGQRRWLESMNAYARQFVQPAARADVDALFGIPPTIAVEQRTSRGGQKSTVGTLTEVHHFLRLLYVKLGTQHCPDCQVPIVPQTRDGLLQRLLRDYQGRRLQLLAPLVIGRKGIYNELAAWARQRGYAQVRVDGELIPTDAWPRLDRFREHDIDLPVGELLIDSRGAEDARGLLERALDLGKGLVRVLLPDQSDETPAVVLSTSRTCPSCGTGFDEPDPRLFSYNSKHGWCPRCFGTGRRLKGFTEEATGEEGRWMDEAETGAPCPACEGRRLRPEALSITLEGRSIAELSALTAEAARDALAGFDLTERNAAIAGPLIAEIDGRLAFLSQVGLGYLTLDRAAPTLSGGEAQRIRLAAQLGASLRGVCYILDEPSIGLHARDNGRLLGTLTRLRDQGNTVIVVEHDEAAMRAADEIIDLGPGAGREGGTLVARGTAAELSANPASITGRCLLGRSTTPAYPDCRPRPCNAAAWLTVHGASRHNLRNLNLRLPLARLVCVTGVSGSGKSTLARDIIAPSLRNLIAADRSGRRSPPDNLIGCAGIEGWQHLSRVLEVDQTPIGKTPRSCPATYIGFWDQIRRLFAASPDARMLGWGPGRFSFNTAGGRCDACDGQGVERLEMSFLPNVELPCEVCGGTRFNAETRAVRYLNHSIAEVLALAVDDAVTLFEAHPTIRHPLELLQAIGLGYLELGQPSPTLSGGEAQRIKLVTELAKARPVPGRTAGRPTLYLLDEPTVGLHMADITKLIGVLHRLVDAGHSVLVVEHDLQLIAAADWVLDLGPEGGTDGGQLIAEGPPSTIAQAGIGHTAKALQDLVRERPR